MDATENRGKREIEEKIEQIREEVYEEEKKCKNIKNPTWDDVSKFMTFVKAKLLDLMNSFINSRALSKQEKTNWRFFRLLLEQHFNNTELITGLGEMIDELREGVLSVTTEVEKVKGTTKELEEIKAKLDEIPSGASILEVSSILDGLKKMYEQGRNAEKGYLR